MITETVSLTFESELHRRLHLLLVAKYASEFDVKGDLKVGRSFRLHGPMFPIRVELKDVDESLESLVINAEKNKILSQDDFSLAEWQWISQQEEDEVIFLDRFLHVQTKVRPHYYKPSKPRPTLFREAKVEG